MGRRTGACKLHSLILEGAHKMTQSNSCGSCEGTVEGNIESLSFHWDPAQKEAFISLYTHCISIASSMVLTDNTKWWFLLSMGYLHLGLVENIFAFINRNEGRSDVAQRSDLSSLRLSSEYSNHKFLNWRIHRNILEQTSGHHHSGKAHTNQVGRVNLLCNNQRCWWETILLKTVVASGVGNNAVCFYWEVGTTCRSWQDMSLLFCSQQPSSFPSSAASPLALTSWGAVPPCQHNSAGPFWAALGLPTGLLGQGDSWFEVWWNLGSCPASANMEGWQLFPTRKTAQEMLYLFLEILLTWWAEKCGNGSE